MMKMDYKTASILNECYGLASRFEKLDTARAILEEKKKRVEFPDIPMVSRERDHRESEMEAFSDILQVFLQEAYADSNNSGENSFLRVQELPESAEKEFLLALLSLKSGNEEAQRLKAIQHISAALDRAPEDPRYLALASVLQQFL